MLESLAYNVIARIDDLIFVDDTVKKSVAEEHFSIIPPISRCSNKRVSTPFSIHLTSNPTYATPFTTPTPQSSPPGAPISPFITSRASDFHDFFPQNRGLHQFPGGEKKVGDANINVNDNELVSIREFVLAELGRAWSYIEHQGSRKDLVMPRSP